MFRNYLRVALRSLRRDRAYALLNVAGLTVGVACCLLVGLYVLDELGFDRFHPAAERTFRLVETRATPDLGDQHVAWTANPVGPTLADELPEVEAATRLLSLWRMTVERGEHRAYVGDYLIAEPGFFEVFGGFELVRGDRATALAAPNSVVLTETASRQYFGDEDPLGQTLEVEGPGDVTVTGVLADPPANSHLTFSMLFSMPTFSNVPGWDDFLDAWSPDWRTALTYVLLDGAASAPAVETRLATLLDARGDPEDGVQAITLQPLTDVHFGSVNVEDEFNRDKRPVTYVWVFAAVALFVLLIACINYMNLSTARAGQRAQEIGVRKAIGAYRSQLAGQFLSESVVLSFISALVAVVLVALALPWFNDLAGKNLQIAPNGGLVLVAALVAVALLVGVLAGSYPALYLSGFRPARALRGVHVEGRGRLRQSLVVTQFALSIALVVATLTVTRQLDYIQSTPLGYEADHLVAVDINSGGVRRQFRAMRAEMAALPGVEHVSVTSRLPGDWKELTHVEAVPQRTTDASPRTLAFFGADEHFLETFEVALAAGRNFDPARPADSLAVLLNETAVQALGLGEALGQRLVLPRQSRAEDGTATDLAFTVIGVVEDFHFQSLHEAIQPLAIGAWNNPVQSIDYFTARLDPTNVPTTLGALREIGETFDPDRPFEYNFLDDRLAEFYTAEARTARIVGIAAGLAVFVACLGLLGLAAFVAERRKKEIGVRKVLGASVGSIVLLLSKDFARLVLVAAVLAAPLAYVGLRQWLDGFAYRVELGPGVFFLAGALALAIALATVSVRAARAALADPVRSLRSE